MQIAGGSQQAMPVHKVFERVMDVPLEISKETMGGKEDSQTSECISLERITPEPSLDDQGIAQVMEKDSYEVFDKFELSDLSVFEKSLDWKVKPGESGRDMTGQGQGASIETDKEEERICL